MRTQTQQAQVQQQSEAQLRNQIQQSASAIRRQALENARAQLDAQRAQLDAQRAQLDVQQNQGSGVAAIPPIPAPPGVPRGVTITRDGKTVTITGADGVPGTFAQTGNPGFIFRPDIPPGVATITIAFFIMLAFIAVGLPLARAWARRMDRNSAAAPLPFPSDVSDRLERIEHAVESVAIEVERISEGQRFTTKLLTDRGDGAASALPVARPDEFAGGGR